MASKETEINNIAIIPDLWRALCRLPLLPDGRWQDGGAADRTLFRQLKILRNAGAPIEVEKKRLGGFRFRQIIK